MKVGSLFSGIGGLELGLERAGMTVVWQSEIDPYASQVLAKHWPDTPNLGDITTIDWSTVEPVDVICGGYPCQPFSLAGVRRGESDPRHLWPHFAEAIRVLRPRFALLENVPGHLSLGFGRVLGDLAELGFDAEWDCIPAAAVGAPHLRYRVYIVAYARCEQLREQPVPVARRRGSTVARDDGAHRGMADASSVGRHGRSGVEGVGRQESERCQAIDHPGDSSGARRAVADTKGDTVGAGLRARGAGGERRARPGDCGRAPHSWATEPDVGRVADGVPARMDRLRTLGNAVVPQVAEYVGRQIMTRANPQATEGGQP